MYDRTIDSKHLHESITIKIYEPEQFDSLYEHNVIIMQDGDDYFHLGRIATVSDRLHDQFDIVNATFVGIPYKDRFDRWKNTIRTENSLTRIKHFCMMKSSPSSMNCCRSIHWEP